MRLRHLLCSLCIGAVAGFAVLTSPAHAFEVDAPPLSAAELEEFRGGFVLPNGVEVQMGAVARSYLDGELALETHFTWGEDGVERVEIFSAPEAGASDIAQAAIEFADIAGKTAFAHDVTSNSIRNIVVNTANGHDIRQETQLSLVLPGFEATQQSYEAARSALRLADEMRFAAGVSGP